MRSASSNEDFTRRKFLTGMTRGVLASAVVAGSSGLGETATGQPSVRVNAVVFIGHLNPP